VIGFFARILYIEFAGCTGRAVRKKTKGGEKNEIVTVRLYHRRSHAGLDRLLLRQRKFRKQTSLHSTMFGRPVYRGEKRAAS
jgi:hypothetical protein